MPFYVHKDLIVLASDYFRKAFDSADEDEKLCLDLPDEDPSLMGELVGCIYWPGHGLVANLETFGHEERISILTKLYLLGVRLDVHFLQRSANESIMEVLKKETADEFEDLSCEDSGKNLNMRVQTIREVYANTFHIGDPLRETLVAGMVRHWGYFGDPGMADNDDGSKSELSKLIGDTPGFARDLLRFLSHLKEPYTKPSPHTKP